MPQGYRTSTDQQLQVLALFARGDTAREVSSVTGIPESTLSKIKERNKDNLEIIKSRLIEHEVSKSKRILDKAQGIMDRKLTRLEKDEQVRDDALRAFQEGRMTAEEYSQRTYGLGGVTLTELNSVAREAFNQSQIESGKPTSISSSPVEARNDLVRLVEELKKDHNEEELLALVFDRELIEGEVSG